METTCCAMALLTAVPRSLGDSGTTEPQPGEFRTEWSSVNSKVITQRQSCGLFRPEAVGQ